MLLPPASSPGLVSRQTTLYHCIASLRRRFCSAHDGGCPVTQVCGKQSVQRCTTDAGAVAGVVSAGGGPVRSYCQNLSFREQQQQVVVDGRYIDYDCVLPIGRAYTILVAQVCPRLP